MSIAKEFKHNVAIGSDINFEGCAYPAQWKIISNLELILLLNSLDKSHRINLNFLLIFMYFRNLGILVLYNDVIFLGEFEVFDNKKKKN